MEKELSEEQQATLRRYIDEHEEALRHYRELSSRLSVEHQTLRRLELASERLRIVSRETFARFTCKRLVRDPYECSVKSILR